MRRILAGLILSFANPLLAGDLPADASGSVGKTLVAKVVVNSGRLEWVTHKRDLTPWPTLSYQDHRPTPEPRRVEAPVPINGDAVRGKMLAWDWCITCHTMPGDEWPGSVGSPMWHYKQHNHANGLVYQQIFDARVFNPNTVMPAFGTFGLLADQDIRDLVAYLQSIE